MYRLSRVIAKKRPGRTRIFSGEQAQQLVALIEAPERVQRSFWTAKGFHGYLSLTYEIECGYRSRLHFFYSNTHLTIGRCNLLAFQHLTNYWTDTGKISLQYLQGSDL